MVERLEKIAESETAPNELQDEQADNYLDSTNFANDTINEGNVKKRIRDLKGKLNANAEIQVLKKYGKLKEDIADGKRVQKVLKYELLTQLEAKYKALTEDETKTLVVENKWMATLAVRLNNEMLRISQRLSAYGVSAGEVSQALTSRVRELAERYDQTLAAIDGDIVALEEKVKKHLSIMGFTQ